MSNIYGELENNSEVIICSGSNNKNEFVLCKVDDNIKFVSLKKAKVKQILTFELIYGTKNFHIINENIKYENLKIIYPIDQEIPLFSGYSYSFGLKFDSDVFSSIDVVKLISTKWFDENDIKRSGVTYLIYCLKKENYSGHITSKWKNTKYCEGNQKCGKCFGTCKRNMSCEKNDTSYLCVNSEDPQVLCFLIYLFLIISIYIILLFVVDKINTR
jgi:hypothetical protein